MTNFIKMVNSKKAKIIFILFLLFFLYICISAYSYVYSVSNNLCESVFRLHVIANSDSENDQILKYNVRDNIIKYINKLCNNCNSKEDVINIVQNNIDEIKEIAQKTISDEGYDYNVNIKIGNFMFPTKNYGDISLPAGFYDALRIEIGSANGKNWWCVLYPSLCFVNVTSGIVPDDSKENLKNSLSDEEYNLVSNSENNQFKFKFKLIEFFNKTPLITARN